MDGSIVELAAAGGAPRSLVGVKASVLGELAAAGFPVPPGFVVPASIAPGGAELAQLVAAAADRIGPGPFAVRSSAAAEDLPDASYAGLYESFLDVPRAQLVDAVAEVVAAAVDPRVAAYLPGERAVGEGAPAVAVLVQQMVDAAAAGVAFTSDPVTGDRASTVVTAVAGLGERLVSGEAVGEEWRVRGGRATCTRADRDGPVLDATEAFAVAVLAERVADHCGPPQDIEWALDRQRRLYLLQGRPMTALPEPVDWTPPGPGVWWRNFRIGEWLPEAMTPLFADWLLPELENGYQAGMRADIGADVPFRRATINGWYYTAPPVPSLALLARIVLTSRGRAPRVLFHALIQVSRNPAAADRALLGRLAQYWRQALLPGYRRQVADAEAEFAEAPPERLLLLVDELGRTAGTCLWSLAIVGGSAWKVEAALTRFCRRHLDTVTAVADDPQVLLRGLPGTAPQPAPPHAVLSLDWHEPTTGETGATATPSDQQTAARRHARLGEQRATAETACRAALADRPKLLADFTRLLEVAQRYAELREEQARDLTVAWPVLRGCVHRIGRHLKARELLTHADDVFFVTRSELDTSVGSDAATSLADAVATRRAAWQRQRGLVAPLTLGTPLPVIGDPIAKAVTAARGSRQLARGAIVGQPASAGRATGPIRLVTGPADFAAFKEGDVLLAATTAPAFTPLFARAAAVVTDGGTLAAHASLIAREYGIPAVVGAGDATHRLHTGQVVTVDGGAGTVIPVHVERAD